MLLSRALALISIVAAFPVLLDAAPLGSEDVPVPVEVVAVARTLGLDPPRDRARFVAEFARLLYTTPFGKSPAVAALLNPKLIDPEAARAERPMQVPVPLSADIWSRAIFRRLVPREALVAAIMADRRAALLSYGLAALDDETLDYLGRHGGTLTRLYEASAPAFAAFGASVRIHAGRVVPPGGQAAAPLWEAVVRQRTSDPEAFLRVLFQLYEGRLAYLYDTIDQLDAPRAAFVLGTWLPDPSVRLLRFAALVDVCSRGYREWRLDTLPFSRPLHDLGMLFLRMRVDATGAPAPPSERTFWSEVFATDDLDAGSVSFSAAADREPIDAAWLASTTNGRDMFERGDRVDQFAFGQRVFAGVADDARPAAVVAIRALPRQRMLSLTLERIGITSPAVYASIARRASRVTGGSSAQPFWPLAQLQSSAALVARMTITGTLTTPTGERLLMSLFALPLESDRRTGVLAGWLRDELLPHLPEVPVADPTEAIESRLMAAMAGPDPGPSAPRVSWEGQRYRVDFAHGERQRLTLVRARQEGYSVDVAMALDRMARTLASDGLTIDVARQVAAQLAEIPATFARRVHTPSETRAPDVDEPQPLTEWLERVSDDLARSLRNSDLRRAARFAPTIQQMVDTVLADALLALAYAADLGDPDGPAMLGRNVALRHDFGFSRKDVEARARSMWSVPRQDFLPGVPWHITGSVLGLDLAMASLALRRIHPDRLPEAPRLPSNERDGFAIGVKLMNARTLDDADRDAIVAAIARGRARVAALSSGGTGAEGLDVLADAIGLEAWRRRALDGIADAIGLDGRRRRALAWMLANDRTYVPEMFSLGEFMLLGGGASEVSRERLDRWGTSALQSEGCACTRMTSPSTWRLLSGRPQIALMASGVPDLNLYIATVLAELGLPSALARPVLEAAVLDFVEGVGPTDANDWWSLVRGARTVPRDLIEDYIAGATTVDGPLVPDDTEASKP